MLFIIVGLEQVVHRLARMLNPHMVFGQDTFRLFGIFVGRVIQNAFEVLVVHLFPIAYGSDQCLGRQDVQIIPLEKPLLEICLGDHLHISTIGGDNDFNVMAFDEVDEILVHHIVVTDVQIPENCHFWFPLW